MHIIPLSKHTSQLASKYHLPSKSCFSISCQARGNLLRWIIRQEGPRRMAAPGFLDSISPWSSRPSGASKPGETPTTEHVPPPTNQALFAQQGGSDHRVSHRKRLSIRDYPEDCPPLNVRWFYAVDVRWMAYLGSLTEQLTRYQNVSHKFSAKRSTSPSLLCSPRNGLRSRQEIRGLSRVPCRSLLRRRT